MEQLEKSKNGFVFTPVIGSVRESAKIHSQRVELIQQGNPLQSDHLLASHAEQVRQASLEITGQESLGIVRAGMQKILHIGRKS